MSKSSIALIALCFAFAFSGCAARPWGCRDGCGVQDLTSSCNDCGTCAPNPRNPIEHVFGRHNTIFASGGCGEVYWDDWSDSPPSCDPCNTASPYGSWGVLGGITHLWGFRHTHDCGCSSCAGGHEVYDDAVYTTVTEPEVIRSEPTKVVPENTDVRPGPEAEPMEKGAPAAKLNSARSTQSIVKPKTATRSGTRTTLHPRPLPLNATKR